MFTLIDVICLAATAAAMGFVTYGACWIAEGHNEMMEMDFEEAQC